MMMTSSESLAFGLWDSGCGAGDHFAAFIVLISRKFINL